MKKIDKREVIIKQLVNRAAEGKPREMELLLLKMDLLQRDWQEPGRAAGELTPEVLEKARILIHGILN